MSITDELREWAKTLTRWWYDPVKDEYTYTTGTMPPSIDAIRMDSNIIAIADRIDAEHESACAEAYGNGVMSVPIALDENAWVELPKDADGEYINVGDRLEGYGKTIEVVELRYGRSGWVIISRDGNGYADTFAFTHHKPTAIADRIDAEHEQQMAERRRSCVFYDAERNYCKVHDEGDMAELGYVRLPVDTDGVPIRIGDVMEWVPYDDTYQTVVRKVVAVGADVFFAWSDEKHGYAQYEACAYRHHHAPTVEDVLREFAYGLGVPVADSYVAAAAAKLRLAGSDAE